MLNEIKKLLRDCEINTISKLNCEQVMEIYNTNQEYSILTEGKKADIEDCLETIEQVPPNFNPENKFFISIWKDSNVIGILDFLVGYPNEGDIWIGLLLIHGKLHGKKIGSTIVNAVLEASKNNGFTSIQLGVIKTNISALRFWESMGFEKVRETKVERIGKSDWNVIVMEKCIV